MRHGEGTLSRRARAHLLLVVVLTISLVLASPASLLVLSQSIYTPRWHSRPDLTTSQGVYTVDYLASSYVSLYNNHLYVVGNFHNGSLHEIAVFAYDINGTILQSIYIRTSGGYNLTANSVTVGDAGLYVVGDEWNETVSFGIVLMLDPANLSLIGGVGTVEGEFYFHGVCTDADGNVYITGMYIGETSHLHELFVASFDKNLNLINATIYYNNSYNLTGWSCIVGPDGYLYVTGTEYYYTNGYNYPYSMFILKLDPFTLAKQEIATIPLYNSQNYTTLLADAPIGIDQYPGGVVVSFTYTDDLPSSTNPTTGAAIAVFDTDLSMLWRANLTTDYYEVFTSIKSGSDGSLVVGGYTDNTYETNLSSSVWNSIVLLLDSEHNIKRAVLSGDFLGLSNTLTYSVAVGPDGYTYWAGRADSDDLFVEYYDITGSVSLNYNRGPLPGRTAGQRVSVPALGGSAIIGLASKAVANASSLLRKPLKLTLTEPPGVSVSPGGEAPSSSQGYATLLGYSEAIVVALNDTITPPTQPPPPVSEPALLGLAVASLLALLLARRRLRRCRSAHRTSKLLSPHSTV